MAGEPNAIFRGVVRSARRTPGAVAIRFVDRSWTYAQLIAAAVAFADELTRQGVHAGDRVAFLGRNSDAYAIGYLAVQYLGAIHVPINFMLREHEVAYILNHSAPRLLFTDDEFSAVARAAVTATGPHIDCLPLQAPQSFEPFDFAEDQREPPELPQPAQIAYTSGTESAPKGALLSDQGLVHQYLSCIAVGEYLESDVVVHALPLYHCAQLHCFLIPSLFLGNESIILDRVDIGEVIETIRSTGATSFFAPPTVWIGILGHPGFDPQKLSTLRKGYYGASIMPTEVIHRMREQLPWLRFWNYYGQTEIGPLATALRPEEHEERPASAGRPVLFVETRVVDDDMRDVAPGAVGEIVHRSPQLLMRYYRDPEKTTAAFEGGWFHSGDLGVMDDKGYITIVDRKKDMINSGGENVASREVEEAIYKHPAVDEVAVVGLPDPKWVERVCAAIVLKAGSSATSDDILRACENMAPFKRPKDIAFVASLPKNPSGKILKRELRQLLSDAANI
ncbi:fatty acyl-CoA synthetase [Sphingobium estronivorans]|uniref:fatty acyl-CoA synthetase n=1 Tax=Sphingobium estronivorans TaxID=1577690 RepID=UPI00123AA9A0|nr:fatty acyl-CoA synthetase [Sphingobium estronivorans]